MTGLLYYFLICVIYCNLRFEKILGKEQNKKLQRIFAIFAAAKRPHGPISVICSLYEKQ